MPAGACIVYGAVVVARAGNGGATSSGKTMERSTWMGMGMWVGMGMGMGMEGGLVTMIRPMIRPMEEARSSLNSS